MIIKSVMFTPQMLLVVVFAQTLLFLFFSLFFFFFFKLAVKFVLLSALSA